MPKKRKSTHRKLKGTKRQITLKRNIGKAIISKVTSPSIKNLSNPISTGGGGPHFEANVQAFFLVFMLTEGFAPLTTGKIKKIKLQGKHAGWETDDLIIFFKSTSSDLDSKTLVQIKRKAEISKSNKSFREAINSAWKDFNDPKLFEKGKDRIALITGLLSASDNEVRDVLEMARRSESSVEFFRKINRAKYISRNKIKKLEIIRSCLEEANEKAAISDERFFEFLNHYYVLVIDLDIPDSICLAFLYSRIDQFSDDDIKNVWARLVDEVQNTNKYAGTIALENLSDDLKKLFQKRPRETPSVELSKGALASEIVEVPENIDLNQIPSASELAIANLIGEWDENSDADKSAVSNLSKANYDSWISKVREVIQQPKSPLSIKNRVVSVTNRTELWAVLGPRIFDDHLDLFYGVAMEVLKEKDPQFDLPKDERYAASMHGKVMRHSRDMRKGISDGLLLLGARPDALVNCSIDKAKFTANRVVHDLLSDADWHTWGSLNDLLPFLAEASPEQFLSAVEAALRKTPCPFDELFSQEASGFAGRTYITGLLWALEVLAWDDQYLIPASVILGKLAARDPGGNWGNRPAHSLTALFLPWLPQTMAPVEKRKTAVQALVDEVPEVAWKLLLTLLPNQTQSSSGCQKPKLRQVIPDNYGKSIPRKEYGEQSVFYSDLAVKLAKNNTSRLSELISDFDNLPKGPFEELLKYLESEEIQSRPESDKLPLWSKLTEFCARHKRFPSAKWALSSELISKIQNVAKQLEPKNALYLNKRLFSNLSFELFDEKKDWKTREQELEVKRQEAVTTIFKEAGIDSILELVEMVELPGNVGYAFGFSGNSKTDSHVLPKYLETENNKYLKFINGYIWGRYRKSDWAWADSVDKTNWTPSQHSKFLMGLPFSSETWERVKALPRAYQDEYWNKVQVNPYQTNDLDYAIDRLCELGRPLAALECIYKNLYELKVLDKSRAVKALLSSASTKEPPSSLDGHHIEEIIKFLQDSSDTNPVDLFNVEWVYLRLLDRPGSTVEPKTLERHLSEDPAFFCEAIRILYRPKKDRKELKGKTESTPEKQELATNVYHLLNSWHVVPGTQPDGSFSEKAFENWLSSVIKMCEESGHLEVALITIGHVLINSPQDLDGLWIHRKIAEVLNRNDYGDMRQGFSTAFFNSRGAHMVDPSGEAEKVIAQSYRKKADDVENAGYFRLASTLRMLAESYESDAKRIISEHKKRNEQ